MPDLHAVSLLYVQLIAYDSNHLNNFSVWYIVYSLRLKNVWLNYAILIKLVEKILDKFLSK